MEPFLDIRYTIMLTIRERVSCYLMNGSMSPGLRLINQFRMHVENLALDGMIYEGCNDGKILPQRMMVMNEPNTQFSYRFISLEISWLVVMTLQVRET